MDGRLGALAHGAGTVDDAVTAPTPVDPPGANTTPAGSLAQKPRYGHIFGAGGAPPPDGPETVVVRQWTDPNRYGEIVVIGGGPARLPSGGPSFGRGMLSHRMERGRITGSRIAGSSIPKRTRRVG